MESRINVRPQDGRFVLYHGEHICGGRLYKGENLKKPAEIWPFHNREWVTHNTEAEANEAMAKLQRYLDAREATLLKK